MDSNLFWCIIGIIGGAIFSLLISLFFYYKSLNRKRLTYDIKTFCIISDKINQIKGLEVKYNSNEIENLFSSTITIRNIGNSIIEETDFASSHPLLLSTTGRFFADNSNNIELVNYTKGNKISLDLGIDLNKKICNQIQINFDFLPQKGTFRFSIFHTEDISFNGILKDGTILVASDAAKRKKFIRTLIDFILPVIAAILGYFLMTIFEK